MKIGYFADGPWAHQALEKIVASAGMDIAFIVPRYSSQDPILRAYAEKLDIPYIIHPDVNSEEFLNLVRPRHADIFVSMSFDQIFKEPIIHFAPMGLINCHAGALPYYRGRNILNWALINGEKTFGVTVHYVNVGIDTGDILVQRFGAIEPADDYGTVLEKAVIICADALHEALHALQSGGISRTVQSSIHPVGFYCTQRRAGDEWLDWHWPSQRIHNFVRGIAPPGPAARTLLDGKILAVAKTTLIPNAPNYIGNPGEVVGRSANGMAVKTGDSTILVTDFREVNADGRLSAANSMRQLKRGSRLGLSAPSVLFDMESRILRLERKLAEMTKKS